MKLIILQDKVSEMEELVDSGDIVLAERRRVFLQQRNRHTDLTDEKITIACAALDDDDDELFAAIVEQIEKGEYSVI